MTWSLQIRNGDLTLSGSSYGAVTGKQKLVQDLRCHILERMGTDSAHLGYGSLIDGGVTLDGQQIASLVGQDADFAELELRGELTRIVAEHQQKQLARAKADKVSNGKATLTPSEVLYSLLGIDIVQDFDTLTVTLRIQTADGQDASLDLFVTT